jgi:hypothetical protein
MFRIIDLVLEFMQGKLPFNIFLINIKLDKIMLSMFIKLPELLNNQQLLFILSRK